MDWKNFKSDALALHPDAHVFNIPCPADTASALLRELEQIPPWLVPMLDEFNGAELYIRGIPFITLFGVPAFPKTTFLQPDDWFLMPYTKSWRTHMSRGQDVAFGITSYGGLLVWSPDRTIGEWDTNTRSWLQHWNSIDECMKWVINDGEQVISDI